MTGPGPAPGDNRVFHVEGEPVPRDADAIEGDALPVPGGQLPVVGPAVRFLDNRTGLVTFGRSALEKVFPDHWTFLLGEIAAFSFIVLLITGTYLTLFFRPDGTTTIYTGPYAPLDGTKMSAAFSSVLALSFSVEGGLLARQAHHWAALLFIAAIVTHLTRIFLTGAFRRPRELNWVIGFTLLLLALAEGITGYSLPDDLLSGTGLRIIYSIIMAIPFLGPWIASLLFGGLFPTTAIISRLFIVHVLLLPGALIGLISVHLLFVWIQKHTQYKIPGATEHNVIGLSLWPGQAFRSIGAFLLTAAVIALLGGLFEINPVWIYGPYVPYAAAVPAQPDYYVGWLEGLVRMAPNWQLTLFGITILPEPFIPGLVVPGVLFTVLWIWPFIEAFITGDRREHNLLDWPWEAPWRAATGAAFATIFLVLLLEGANDVLAAWLLIPVENLTQFFRIMVFAGPVIAWIVTYRLARARLEHGTKPIEPRGGIALRRNATGGFEEVHDRAAVDAALGGGGPK
ncbi:MAG: cytochrome b N-terminal domain-containing protein [Chloroflexi bacterium]|nr:cytochrome b N-terminal domain-containing protein [Chloroflexota bacterium]